MKGTNKSDEINHKIWLSSICFESARVAKNRISCHLLNVLWWIPSKNYTGFWFSSQHWWNWILAQFLVQMIEVSFERNDNPFSHKVWHEHASSIFLKQKTCDASCFSVFLRNDIHMMNLEVKLNATQLFCWLCCFLIVYICMICERHNWWH